MTKMNMKELSINELDMVAGGFAEENYSDMTYLKEQCGIDVVTGDYDLSVQWLKDNYASAGINFKAYDHKANKFRNMYTGKAMSHNEALATLIEYGHSKGRWG